MQNTTTRPWTPVRRELKAALAAAMLLAAVLAPAYRSGAQDDARKPGFEKNKLEIANLVDLKEDLSFLDELEKKKDWDKLVTFCEQLMDQAAGKMVQKSETLFVSAADVLTERLTRLGAEARLAYRARYDRSAERAFRAAVAANDSGMLAQVAGRFPLSGWADDALSVLSSIEAERGNFSAALLQLERLLSQYPDTDQGVNMLNARAAWYCYYSRDSARAEHYLKKLRGSDGPEIDEAVRCRVSELGDLLGAHRLPEIEGSRDQYAEGIARGDYGRAANPGRISSMRDIAWQGRLFGSPTTAAELRNSRVRQRSRNRPQAPGSDDFRYQSVVYDDRVYTPTEVGVNVFDMRSGRLLMELQAPGGGEYFPGLDTHLVPTVTRDTVYANLIYEVSKSEDWSGILVSAAIPRYALCAFNRETGKLRWIAHQGEKFKKYFEGKWHSMLAAPVVLGDKVYAEVKVRQMLVKSFLAAFDACTGEMEWVTPLCSNGTELTMFHYDARGPLASMLVAEEGATPTIYCSTNLGAVFAIDPRNGRVRWCSLYDQIPLRAAEAYYAQMRTISWQNCPPILSGGVLVAAPLDSRDVCAFEASTGKMLWKYSCGAQTALFNELVGAVDGHVILAGTRLMALGLRSGKVKWASTSFGGLGSGGQGLLSSKEIVLPRPEGLYRFSTDSGKVQFQESWPARSMDDEPGNLLQAGDRLIVTGTSKVTVYKDKSDR